MWPILLPFLGSFLGVVASFPLQLLVFRHQKKLAKQEHEEQRSRDDIAYRRAIADKFVFPAYQVIKSLVMTSDNVYFAILRAEDSETVKERTAALEAARNEAWKAQSAYILIGKEEAIRKAIYSYNEALDEWSYSKKYSLDVNEYTSKNLIPPDLAEDVYEAVRSAAKRFAAQEKALLKVASDWIIDLS